jgi:hypothetical protein
MKKKKKISLGVTMALIARGSPTYGKRQIATEGWTKAVRNARGVGVCVNSSTEKEQRRETQPYQKRLCSQRREIKRCRKSKGNKRMYRKQIAIIGVGRFPVWTSANCVCFHTGNRQTNFAAS